MKCCICYKREAKWYYRTKEGLLCTNAPKCDGCIAYRLRHCYEAIKPDIEELVDPKRSDASSSLDDSLIDWMTAGVIKV